MLDELIKYTEANKLCTTDQHLLVAVSGGVDSMVLSDLLLKGGYRISIAHCNFSLRGEESDGDEAFVKAYAEEKGVPFYSKRFDTEAYAKDKGISIQMAARELRYNWLKHLSVKTGAELQVTAHHATDNVETILINMLRGTGLAGYHGISPSSDGIIRPLLFASRDRIAAYAKENNIRYREDSSNSDDKYQRNNLRHHVLPVFSSIKPGFEEIFLENAALVRQYEDLLDHTLEERYARICSHKGEELHINIEELESSGHVAVMLHYILEPYGLGDSAMVNQVMGSLKGQSGKTFIGRGFRLIRDRENLVVVPLAEAVSDEIFLLDGQKPSLQLDNVEISVKQFVNQNYRMKRQPSEASLDCDKLKFPLTVRRWQHGDFFIPLGMRGYKKISDLLTDEKVPLHEKEKQWVVLNGDEIVWVVGRRISDKYKLTRKTRNVLELSVNLKI